MSARGWRLGAGAEGEDAVRSKKKEVVGALQASRGEAPELGGRFGWNGSSFKYRSNSFERRLHQFSDVVGVRICNN